MATQAHVVSPEEIQNELNKIWESLETTNTTRACLFNLILYTQKNHRMPYIQKIAQKVVERFPSRVIFIVADREKKEDGLKTEVSILASSSGEFDIACDYIQVEASGASLQRIPFLILPHILPDLPVYVVWADDPSRADPLSYELEQFANRVIFDSEATDHLPRFAHTLLTHHDKSQCDIADLNWARIESWRDMFSMAFHSEEKLKELEKAQKIQITYNGQESAFFCHTHIQAIYLQAWLACQLSWKFLSIRKEKDKIVLSYQTAQAPLEISLIAEHHAELPPGIIQSVDINTVDSGHFSFMRNPQILHQITLQYSTLTVCELPFCYIFSRAESGHSLVKEICHRGTSLHYLKVLNLVKTMDTQGLC